MPHILVVEDEVHLAEGVAFNLEAEGHEVENHEIETDLSGAIRFIDATKIPYQAPSLGGVESLIELPVTMSFWDYTPEQRQGWGITDSLVRLACGVEAGEDLIADMEQALTKV